jgi:hypothetical protein
MKRKMNHCEVKSWLRDQGISFRRDFFEMASSDVGLIVDGAKKAGYRKSKNAPGSTGRMYFQLLKRKSCFGDLSGARRRR